MNRRGFLKLLGLAAAAPVAIAVAKALPAAETVLVVTAVDREARSITTEAVPADGLLYGVNSMSYAEWSGRLAESKPVTLKMFQDAVDAARTSARWQS